MGNDLGPRLSPHYVVGVEERTYIASSRVRIALLVGLMSWSQVVADQCRHVTQPWEVCLFWNHSLLKYPWPTK